MAPQTSQKFINSTAARLCALCIALLLGIIFAYNYKDDLGRLMSSADEEQLLQSENQTTEETNDNPALAACLLQRIGDVDRMKEEGILSEAQYASFRARAEDLCQQQNPG